MIRFCASLCFLNDAATPEIYTLSLHDALPIYQRHEQERQGFLRGPRAEDARHLRKQQVFAHAWRGHAEDLLQLQGLESRSEEHTSELQSPYDLVCRLLLEKKKTKKQVYTNIRT